MKREEKRALWVTAALLAIGAALIVFGALRGEVRTVLDKAVRICTECMGLG